MEELKEIVKPHSQDNLCPGQNSCQVHVQYKFGFAVQRLRPPLWSSGQSSWLQNGDVLSFL
jgi:hypothetical protein